MADSPQTTLKNALGAAYSASVAGTPRNEIVSELHSVIANDVDAAIIDDHLLHLDAVVRARSVGGRCGCHISQLQLDLLREALDAG